MQRIAHNPNPPFPPYQGGVRTSRPAQNFPRDRRTHAAIALLLELGADKIAHANGRSFMQHLVGTAQLLLKWNVDIDIVRAGLCHSIYGTNAFRHTTLAHDQRPRLQRTIGRRAEALVWHFATLRRPQTLQKALRYKRKLVRTRSGHTHHLDRNSIEALFALECANLLDQGCTHHTISQLLHDARCGAMNIPALLAELQRGLHHRS